MARFYAQRPSPGGTPLVAVKGPDGGSLLVEVSVEVSRALEDMQREAWRLERREARHELSLDAMLPCVAADDEALGPEAALMRRCDSDRLLGALASLPKVQLRRLLMYAVAQIPVREIAAREGCSERAVKYSLSKARKRMREILSEGFPG